MVTLANDKNWELSPIPTLDEFLTCSLFVAFVIAKIVARMLFNICFQFHHAILDPCFSLIKELGMLKN